MSYRRRQYRQRLYRYRFRWGNLKWPQVEEFGWPPGTALQQRLDFRTYVASNVLIIALNTRSAHSLLK